MHPVRLQEHGEVEAVVHPQATADRVGRGAEPSPESEQLASAETRIPKLHREARSASFDPSNQLVVRHGRPIADLDERRQGATAGAHGSGGGVIPAASRSWRAVSAKRLDG